MPDERDRENDAEMAPAGRDAAQAERDAAQAERDAERAERDAERAESDARRAAGGDERDSRLEAARAQLEAARAAYQAAREAHRDGRQREREREREHRHMERAAERLAERALRHEQHRPHVGIDLGALGDLGGEEFTEEVEATFIVEGAPTIRSRNVSGETRIAVGTDRAVRVQARKRVRGSSSEKAKRLLQNVEVRMEQHGDVIDVRPHLYEQDRGWLDLFRGGRVSVDLVITVPREAAIEAHTVSGDLTLTGTRGQAEIQSVSGDVTVEDVQGPLSLRSVSGDCSCTGFVGRLEANTVSGDLTFERSRVRDADIVTASGDLSLAGDLERGGQHRLRTISGDIDLSLAGSAYEIGYKTMSGDVSLDADGRVTKDGRRDRTIHVGAGGDAAHVQVKTVSGDLAIRTSSAAVPDDAAPAAAPAAAPDTARSDAARDILERLARGELDVDGAAAALDAARGR